MSLSRHITKSEKARRQWSKPLEGEGGQLVIEYVLLLVVGVTLALSITTIMVNRNPEQPGFLVAKWDQIVRTIGNDMAGEIDPN